MSTLNEAKKSREVLIEYYRYLLKGLHPVNLEKCRLDW